MLIFSCRPQDFLRDFDFIRNIFYPEVYQRKGLGEDTPGTAFDHSVYSAVLNEFVSAEGEVDYNGLAAKPENLDLYITLLGTADLKNLSRYERLALIINAYNAFTLKLILDYPGIGSIKDIGSDNRWDAKRWNVGGEVVSLDHIEHEMIRKNYGEPLVHFALVCASVSCPKLRNEPYAGNKLLSQLEDQSSDFFSNERNFRWDKESKTVYLSEILDWFRHDFADDEKGVVRYTLKYLDDGTAGQIKENIDDIKVKYITYDWSLNGPWGTGQ